MKHSNETIAETSPDTRSATGETQTALDWREGDMPYSLAFDDHFYCQTDGRLECGHVFLSGNGLPQRWLEQEGTFRIGELGFGTGLNLCETWRQWKETRKEACNGRSTLHFMSFELYPMKTDEIDRALSRWPEVDAERKALVARWPDEPKGEVEIELDDQTRLTVVCGEALAGIASRTESFDAWFLDGFAPARNPDMWSLEIMQALLGKTAPEGTFATYAAAGFVRRNLIAAGFGLERRKGFAGKREMLCGIKPSS
ncbi:MULTISPECIES: tRNA (5-methylaminomethyl-2-thiouridine)(34)-methyltransferase MnmD [unclassified Rhizobium]|uniref:tRNA (5-methylaminomethyl-2-thiouridine)(34)-methyltransferase MnmD n=1 Tax=unclassified Rhizobium TaxID=2613769 RepID=UPI0024784FE7|nr:MULTISPECIES: tRNA (5-methylaminomethyl-2-thiouridine)(34)-methyltransferase MnmD [unclassified Rhizobium]MDH7801641.1 tRNA U34 5-methylaminomethyl-2-thiouridine-forming methyltransferase MnmC [Rhizobium sp. AN70]